MNPQHKSNGTGRKSNDHDKIIMEMEQNFVQYIRDHNLRLTDERYILFDEVVSRRQAFDIKSIEKGLKDKGVKISCTTIYQNIKLLTSSGVVAPIPSRRKTRYITALMCRHHALLHCQVCDKIVRHRSYGAMSMLQKFKPKNFQPQLPSLIYVGICSICSKKQNKQQTRVKSINENCPHQPIQ